MSNIVDSKGRGIQSDESFAASQEEQAQRLAASQASEGRKQLNEEVVAFTAAIRPPIPGPDINQYMQDTAAFHQRLITHVVAIMRGFAGMIANANEQSKQALGAGIAGANLAQVAMEVILEDRVHGLPPAATSSEEGFKEHVGAVFARLAEEETKAPENLLFQARKNNAAISEEMKRMMKWKR